MTGCRNIITVSYPMISNVVSLIPHRSQSLLDTSTAFCNKVCQCFVESQWFSMDPVSSTNKVDSHNITEILFKVALSTPKTIYTP